MKPGDDVLGHKACPECVPYYQIMPCEAIDADEFEIYSQTLTKLSPRLLQKNWFVAFQGIRPLHWLEAHHHSWKAATPQQALQQLSVCQIACVWACTYQGEADSIWNAAPNSGVACFADVVIDTSKIDLCTRPKSGRT